MGSTSIDITTPRLGAARDESLNIDDKQDRKMQVAEFDASFAPSARPTVSRKAPWYRDGSYFLKDWLQPSIWKAAVIEFVGTTCLVYTSGQITATLFNYNTPFLGAYISVSNTALISLFIYATAAVSGGHLNPLITFSTFVAGMTPLPRAFLYMCGQILGASLAAGLLIGVWGTKGVADFHGGGCNADYSAMTHAQVFLNELIFSFIILFLAYGVGLDPRQATLFGPRFGPFLVGASLGMLSFASTGISPGYAGAQMNPSRCFAYGIVRGDLSDQWIWWLAPAAASLLQALVYNVIPPHPLEGLRMARAQHVQHTAV